MAHPAMAGATYELRVAVYSVALLSTDSPLCSAGLVPPGERLRRAPSGAPAQSGSTLLARLAFFLSPAGAGAPADGDAAAILRLSTAMRADMSRAHARPLPRAKHAPPHRAPALLSLSKKLQEQCKKQDKLSTARSKLV